MCVTTGRCVPESWKCDGDRDCGEGDNSDEPEECSKSDLQYDLDLCK